MDEVANYRMELQQVQAALALNPANPDLVKLEQDLKDIIALSSQLDPSANPVVEHSWAIGDICEAIFSQDGQYYTASLLELDATNKTCKVKFSDYGNEDIVQLGSIRPFETQATKRKKNSAEDGNAQQSTVKDQRTKVEKEAEREKKKKKEAKRKEKDTEKSEVLKNAANSWKKFNTGKRSSKSKSGFLSGKKKESIFKSPDSVDGKVGVGTCGIGGKGMTDFVKRDKWTYSEE